MPCRKVTAVMCVGSKHGKAKKVCTTYDVSFLRLMCFSFTVSVSVFQFLCFGFNVSVSLFQFQFPVSVSELQCGVKQSPISN